MPLARMLRNRSAILTGVGAGAAVGLLASLAWLALSPDKDPEVPEAERWMGLAEMRSATDAGGIPDAVKWLRQALELEPENERATAGLARARSDAVQAVRTELAAGRPIVAIGLLDIFEAEWPGDGELSDLREDTGELFDELARTTVLADILDRVQIDIAENRLRAPKEENAWDKLGQAAALIGESDRGRSNWIQARRHQIASEYVKLIDHAIGQGSLANARRHMANLEESVSNHPDRPGLRQRIDRLEEARAAREAPAPPDQESPEPPANTASPSPTRPSPPVLADAPAESTLLDQEDEFWSKVKHQYEANANCAILQRYNEEYPGGRFEDEYFALKAQCARHNDR